MAIIEGKYTLGLSDVGKHNLITNKAILKVLENAGGWHSEKAGYGLSKIEENSLSWILLNWKVQVIERPKYNETITIKTWARDSKKVHSYRDYEIYNNNNKLLIRATSKWTLININTGKLEPLTKELIESYNEENKSTFDERELEKKQEPESRIGTIKYKVLRRDIDINKHVHNLYYLDFAYEALPEEVYNQEEFNNIEILYKKQIKLGETISCNYTKEKNKNIVTIKSEDNSILHSIVELY